MDCVERLSVLALRASVNGTIKFCKAGRRVFKRALAVRGGVVWRVFSQRPAWAGSSGRGPAYYGPMNINTARGYNARSAQPAASSL